MLRPSRMKKRFEYNAVAKKIYASARWTRFSKQCLNDEPLCRICQESGRVTIAEHSHHIEKLAIHPELAFVRVNIMSVCKACHATLD